MCFISAQVDYFVIAAENYGPPLYYSTETFERLHSTVRKLFKNSNFVRPLHDLVCNARKILIQHVSLHLNPPPLVDADFVKPHAQIYNNAKNIPPELIHQIKVGLELPEATEFKITYRLLHTAVSFARFGSHRLHAINSISKDKTHNYSKSVVGLQSGTIGVVAEIRSFKVKIKADGREYSTVWMKVIKLARLSLYAFKSTQSFMWVPLSIKQAENPPHSRLHEPHKLVRGLVWQRVQDDMRLNGTPQYVLPYQ